MPRVSLFKQAFERTFGSTQQALNGSYTEDDLLGAVEIRPVRLTLPHLPAAFHGYRVVQISDIHMDRQMTAAHLSRVVHLVNRLKPDVVAVTGDFVTAGADRYADDLVESLRHLSPREASFGVMGNHDHPPWSEPEVIPSVMERSGIIHLCNRVYTIRRGHAMLHIAGIDDITSGNPQLDAVLDQLPPEGVAILLCHAPDFADTSAATGRFALQISGHSHGGQISFPLFGAPVYPRNGKKYPVGCYLINGMYQYTNRGLGLSYPRLRVNCPPEITVFLLQSPQ